MGGETREFWRSRREVEVEREVKRGKRASLRSVSMALCLCSSLLSCLFFLFSLVLSSSSLQLPSIFVSQARDLPSPLKAKEREEAENRKRKGTTRGAKALLFRFASPSDRSIAAEEEEKKDWFSFFFFFFYFSLTKNRILAFLL